MALVKPFRALRYDAGTAGPLDELVSPPHDVLTPELHARLLASSPFNAVRLVRPDDPEEAGKTRRRSRGSSRASAARWSWPTATTATRRPFAFTRRREARRPPTSSPCS